MHEENKGISKREKHCVPEKRRKKPMPLKKITIVFDHERKTVLRQERKIFFSVGGNTDLKHDKYVVD